MRNRTVPLFCLIVSFVLLSAVEPRAAETQPLSPPAARPEQVSLSPAAAFALIAGNAEKGDAAAMIQLGRLYEYGEGVSKNYTKALEWYGKAAQAGLAEGHFNMGVCYEIGMGDVSDMGKALQHYGKAAEMKLPQALYKMSSFSFNGMGAPRDEAKGLQYLAGAAEAGLAQAANDLGVICMRGLYSQPQDFPKALSWFVKASDGGSIAAIANIAAYFDEGTPATVNMVKALKWYMILKQAGVENPSVDVRIATLKSKMDAKQIRASQSEADAWIASRREASQ